MWFSPIQYIRKCLFVMKLSWTNNTFWDVNNKKWRKWYKFVSPILFNNTYGLRVLTIDTKCTKYVFYVKLVELQNIFAKYGLETWFVPNDDIRKCFLDIKHGRTKTHLETWIKRYDVNGVSLFHLSYLITLTVYMCSQLTPNVRIKYFMFDLSIYRKFVLNRDGNRHFPKNDIRICFLNMKNS
jgi:hypothetical protein